MGKPVTSWTPERYRELARLWDDGLTGGEIAARLGVSRNAVLAKARRLNLKIRESPLTAAASAARRKHAERRPEGKPPPEGCRYVLGDPPERWRYCGAPRVAGRSYCAAHLRACTRREPHAAP